MKELAMESDTGNDPALQPWKGRVLPLHQSDARRELIPACPRPLLFRQDSESPESLQQKRLASWGSVESIGAAAQSRTGYYSS